MDRHLQGPEVGFCQSLPRAIQARVDDAGLRNRCPVGMPAEHPTIGRSPRARTPGEWGVTPRPPYLDHASKRSRSFQFNPDQSDSTTSERQRLMLKDWMNWAYSQATVTNCPMLSVLLAIVTHADAAGFCRPSIARLSSLTRLDPRTVQRQIRALEVAGLLRREIGGGWMHKSGDKNQGRASVYQLLRRLESTEPTAETYPDTVPPSMNSTPSACHLRSPIDSRPPRHPAAPT